MRGKYDLDVVGRCARPDIFQLHVDERPKRPVTTITDPGKAGRQEAERQEFKVEGQEFEVEGQEFEVEGQEFKVEGQEFKAERQKFEAGRQNTVHGVLR